MGPSPATSEPTRPSASPRASHRRSRRPDAISASREALHGRPRQGTQSPPRARLSTEGLGKESDLRLARGSALRLARGLIPRITRDQLIHSPSPPPRPVFSTARHVSLILQSLPQSQPDDGSMPQNGRRDLRSHQRHTGCDRARRGLSTTVS